MNYAEALTATFADPLNAMMFTCTGSEANDIALRMARAVTGKIGVIATDHTYHGNTMAVAQLSCTNPPPDRWESVEFVSAPDSYRPISGEGWAQEVEAAIQRLEAKGGHGVSALVLDPFFLPMRGGFPIWPRLGAACDRGGAPCGRCDHRR